MRHDPSRTGSRRVLVIGCGSIGTRHLKNLVTLGVEEIVACDTRPDRLGEVKAQFKVDTVDDVAQAWAYRPHAVVIATPPSLHVPLALDAAERGCHLFIEKPLSDQLDDALERLLAIVQERKLVTLVGCNMRFHPTLRAVKQLCGERAVGHIVAARVEMGHALPEWHPWEDYRTGYSARRGLGGGVILDAIHELDYIRWLLGEVVAVSAYAGKLSQLEIETEDVAAILLRFANGAIGEVHLDYVQRVYSRTCQIIGEEGTIRWDYGTGETRWYTAASRTWQTISNPSRWDPNEMYLDEMRHFLRCLAHEEDPVVDVRDAARTLDVALAAKTSSETGAAVECRQAVSPGANK